MATMVSKDYVFKKQDDELIFVGDFDGLYQDDNNPWGQDGSDTRLADYYIFSRDNILDSLKDFAKYENMLEVGCGLGYVVDFFNLNSKLTCSGADISSVAIKKAKENFPLYDFYCFDIQSENLKVENKYDVVILNKVLWYVLEKLDNVFENIYNMLNKNGIFIISNGFIEEQRYGIDIVNGFDGLMKYVNTKHNDKFKTIEAKLLYKEGLLFTDGCLVMRKING